MNEPVSDSSGNIFIDLGYPPEKAVILHMHADLVACLRKRLKEKGLTPSKTAEMFGVSHRRHCSVTSQRRKA